MKRRSEWAVGAGVLFVVLVMTIVDAVPAPPQSWRGGWIHARGTAAPAR